MITCEEAENTYEQGYEYLKKQVVNLLIEFMNNYSKNEERCLYPESQYIIFTVLTEIIEEMEDQLHATSPLTDKQKYYVCCEIENWHKQWEEDFSTDYKLIEFAKEQLKKRICD